MIQILEVNSQSLPALFCYQTYLWKLLGSSHLLGTLWTKKNMEKCR